MKPTIQIFHIELSTYALMALLGLCAALCLAEFTRRKIGLSRRSVFSFALCCCVGGILGAKLLYLIVEWELTRTDFLHVLTHGGFVFYGGLLGAFLAACIWCGRKSVPYPIMMDFFLPSVSLFHALGRVGCLLAGCCYGRPAEGFPGIVYPEGGIAPAGIPLIPVPLMESAFLLLLTVFLLILYRRSKTPGTVSATYMLLYGIWRFCIEFFRGDPRGSILGFSTSQFISIFLILSGIAFFFRTHSRTQSLP